MPQLWKDAMNLENITNDFLDSNNVTGEVMNLDDFLKELQSKLLVLLYINEPLRDSDLHQLSTLRMKYPRLYWTGDLAQV